MPGALDVVDDRGTGIADQHIAREQHQQAIGKDHLALPGDHAEAIAVVDGQMDVDSAIESVAFATRRLAKKQRTWFRRDPRIHWLDVSDGDEIPQLADRIADIVAGAK